MRMENISSTENEVHSKSKAKDSDHVNHIISDENSINSTSNDEISKTNDVSANDKDVGPTHDGLIQNNTDKDAVVDDTTNLNAVPLSENKTVEVNGDVDDKPEEDQDVVESSTLNSDKAAEVDTGEDVSSKSNDKPENTSEKIDEASSNSNTDKNGSKSADSSQLDSSSLTDKNITNTSYDSEEDYHSATETSENVAESDKNKSTDETREVTNDEVDNSVVRDDSGNFEKTSQISESNDKNEKPTNSPEPMEVDEDESPPPVSITEDKDGKEPEVDQTNKDLESTNENVEDKDTTEISESTNNDNEDSSVEKPSDNQESANENPVSSKDDDETSSTVEKRNEDQITESLSEEGNKDVDTTKTNSGEDQITESMPKESNKDVDNTTETTSVEDQITESSSKESNNEVDDNATDTNSGENQITESLSKESNKDVDNTTEATPADKTSESNDAANDENVNNSTTNTTSGISEAKEPTPEENTDPKNTEVFHVDENDEDPDEVMDTSECDPFGQDNENTTTEAETMEVDGTSSNKDAQNDATEIIDVNLSDENSTHSETTAKSTQEKPSSSENSGDQADENCIIPDNVNNEAPKTTTGVVKPKFDITPVRLEKLMDPSKLASVQERSNEKNQEKINEISSDSESNNLTVTSRPQRRAAKKAESQIKEIVALTESENFDSIEEVDKLSEPSLQVCYRCSRLRQCQYIALSGSKTVYVCQESCLNSETDKRRGALKVTSKLQLSTPQKPSSIPDSIHCLRKCSQCNMHNISDISLSWEAMDFCNEDCLNSYQVQHGSYCAHCKGAVQHTSMGKYSVRFGLEARQFCSGTCLEEFKKGLKSCSYCQHDITKAIAIVSAQVVDKGPMKDFCSQSCVENYERMSTNSPLPVIQDKCTVCMERKNVEVQVLIQSRTHSLCSDVCFMTFKFANNISDIDQCHICMKFYEEGNPDSHFVFHDDAPYNFCSKVCMNVFILFRRKIVPCSWCKVKKYNFDMIKKSSPGGNCVMMCSLNCLTLYQVSMNATSTRKIKCDLCSAINFAQYHLTMSDATIRNFCSYNCVMVFQTQYNKTPLTMHEPNKSSTTPVPMGAPKRGGKVITPPNDIQRNSIQKVITTVANGLLPQLTSATTLKVSSPLTIATAAGQNSVSLMTTTATAKPQMVTKYIQQIIVKPPAPKEMSNKTTQCGVNTENKSVSCQPEVSTQETQTDEASKYPAVIPIPVPVYVPAPMHMFTTPFPVPVPFALPIPVPIFIPTTKNTYKALAQYMKEIVDKTPSNPFEADLLLMAKMVANEDKPEETEEVAKNDSGDDDEMHFADPDPEPESFTESETSTTNNFTDDLLQTAMKMATEQLSNTPTVDLETELTSNTITPQTQTEDNGDKTEEIEVPVEPRPTRARKRANKSAAAGETPTRKRGRQQTVTPNETDPQTTPPSSQSQSQQSQSSTATTSPVVPETERPDVNMCLKFTIGIRAWKQWLLTKNDQIEQAATAANKKAKTFNLNILKLTTDELNYLLCLFVKEVRKPNGEEYAPDTVYYLCLSIQQYLFENGRIDNIFTDSFYEPFTNALDEVAKKFSEINDNTQYIVTRVEEEHLWESKQLGAHSPHVLLATLMFFNTKYFNLATLEEHMQLSFSHIMKHWKRNPNAPVGKPGSPAPNRNVVLRFYPPQAALDAPNSRKKKVYEQHENEVNPLRCPVKLYEFYLSKCPESVKQRNDVFYLQPERSCVPDSPVWYSTMPLQKDLLMKMLHRIRMVKEVNVSLMAS